MSIAEAARETGLASCFIRSGCKDGSIPHIKTGAKYLVNVPGMMEKLKALSMQE